MSIDIKLKEKRLALNLTLEEVAKKVGVAKSTVKKWESGQIANMRKDKIVLLAKALQITPSELLGIQENKPTSDTVDLFESLLAKKGLTLEQLNALPDSKKELILNLINEMIDKRNQ